MSKFDPHDPVIYYAMPSPEEDGWLVFVVHRDTEQWWRRVAHFGEEQRARDYADTENDGIGNMRRLDEPSSLYAGETPAPVDELPALPPSVVKPGNFMTSLAVMLANAPEGETLLSKSLVPESAPLDRGGEVPVVQESRRQVFPTPKGDAAPAARQGNKPKGKPSRVRKTPNWTELEVGILRANANDMAELKRLLPDRNEAGIRRKLALLTHAKKEKGESTAFWQEFGVEARDQEQREAKEAEKREEDERLGITEEETSSNGPVTQIEQSSGEAEAAVGAPNVTPNVSGAHRLLPAMLRRKPPVLGGAPLSREEELAKIAEYEATIGVTRVEYDHESGRSEVVGGARDPQVMG